VVAKKLLRDTYPDLREQFDVSLNVGVTFDELFVIFNEKIFWNCPAGHLIHQKPRLRTQGKCSVCSIERSRKYLRDHHMDLLKEFSPSNDEEIDPSTLYSSSPDSFLWTCNRSGQRHEYKATVKSRIMGHGCPYCGGSSILPGFNDWTTIEPLETLIWDYARNLDSDGNPIDPTTLGLDNRTMYYWICITGNHERIISISSAVQGKRAGKECRTCAGYKSIAGVSDAFTLYPHLQTRLSPIGNQDINLLNLHPGNRAIMITWCCENNHTWKRSFAEELSSKGCGKCLGTDLWEGQNDLLSQFPDVASEIAYDLNAELEGFLQVPSGKVHQNSSLDSWWRCTNHGHTWRTKVEKRTREGTGCPFCSDRRVWPGFNDLWTKRPDLVDEIDFDKHAGLDPKKLLWVSHVVLNWVCLEKHKWSATLQVRSSNSNRRPTGCPNCAVSGFKPEEPGMIYWIENKDLHAFKVGITNTGTQRLESWLGKGWVLIRSYEFETGAEARFAEVRFHHWRRNVLLEPDLLQQKHVGRLGGWTETFSNQSVSIADVQAKLNQIIELRLSMEIQN
jgi:hypothetical protein